MSKSISLFKDPFFLQHVKLRKFKPSLKTELFSPNTCILTQTGGTDGERDREMHRGRQKEISVSA